MHQSAPHHCRALLPRAPAPLRSSWWTPEALPPLPLTPSTSHRSLSRSPRSHAAIHHGRLANLAVAASSPLQASTAAATCTTAFASSCCTSRARSSKPSATGAPSPVSRRGQRRRCAWPSSHEPPSAVPGTPTGAREPGAAAAPIPRRHRASFGRQQQVRHSPLLCSATRGLGLKFD